MTNRHRIKLLVEKVEPAPGDKAHWLYILSAWGSIQYVGVTTNLVKRLEDHSRRFYFDGLEVTKFTDSVAAFDAERAAEIKFMPPFNNIGRQLLRARPYWRKVMLEKHLPALAMARKKRRSAEAL